MKIEKYTEFILESEFNEILLDIHMIVESEGKWTGERTYEWDLRGDNDEGEKSVDSQGDWLKSSIQKSSVKNSSLFIFTRFRFFISSTLWSLSILENKYIGLFGKIRANSLQYFFVK